MDCRDCRAEDYDQDCIKCKELISGDYLAEEPHRKIEIELENIDTKKEYSGQLELISPVGLVLRSNVPPGEYEIMLTEKLKLIVTTVVEKGKAPYQVFDISSVLRNGYKNHKLSQKDFELLKMSPKQLIAKMTEGLSLGSREIIRTRLEQAVEKSELLDAFKVGAVFKYYEGEIKSLSSRENITLSKDYLRDFMEETNKEYKRKTVVDNNGDRIYDVHAIAVEEDEGGIIAIDVTDVIDVEKKQQKREIAIYKSVIQAVTGGKLQLLTREEMKEEVIKGHELTCQNLANKEDITLLREETREVLEEFALQSKDKTHIILAVSEAGTNTIKHAGDGEFIIKLIDEKRLRIIIRDQGSGIDFNNLPKATLMKDYSTAATFSLGSGFTIMLRFIDSLFLETSQQGTTIILEVELEGRGKEDEGEEGSSS